MRLNIKGVNSILLQDYIIEKEQSQAEYEKYFGKLEEKLNLKQKKHKIYEKSAKIAGKSDNFINNFKECGSLIGLNNDNKIVRANFCKSRLCPVCCWKKSIKTFIDVKRIITELGENHKYIMLTLTQKNCRPEELDKEIDKINYAFKRLRQKAKFKRAYKGHIRTLEITYNSEQGTFHPHTHIILDTCEGYFERNSDIYITHNEMMKMWSDLINQEHCNLDIRAIHGTSIRELEKAIAEVAKYTLKLSDIAYKEETEAMSTIFTFLTGRRCFTYGGTIKSTAKKLKINLEDEPEDESSENITFFRYEKGHYKKIKK